MDSEFLERLNRSSDYNYISEFNHTSNHQMSKEIFEQIYSNIDKELNKLSFLGGISLFDTEGIQIMIIAKNQKVTDDFNITSQIISEMDPEVFFNELPNKVIQDGLGHLKFDYFEIYFAKLDQHHALSFFVIDKASEQIQKMNNIIEIISNIIDSTNQDTNQNKSSNQQKTTVPEPDEQAPVPEFNVTEDEVPGQKRQIKAPQPTLSTTSVDTSKNAIDSTNHKEERTDKNKQGSNDDLKSSLQKKFEEIND